MELFEEPLVVTTEGKLESPIQETEITALPKQKKGLFASAKTTEKKAAKPDKPEVILREEDHKGISQKLERLVSLREDIADKEAEVTTLEGEIKDIARSEYVKLYEANHRHMGSFRLRGEQGGAMMIIPMDRYKAITTERADELKDKYGDDIVDNKTVYAFNAELLEKYESALSDLILNCPAIADDDKPNLIEAQVKYEIRKGTIEKLQLIASERGAKIADLLSAIEPIVQLKNAR